MRQDVNDSLILLTGASGYVGGRLLTSLVEAGYRVRCLARTPDVARSHVQPAWLSSGQVEVVRGDVLDPESLSPALAGVDAAYYLIHSMGTSHGFEEKDRRGADNFGRAAARAGVKRILYLGGLGSGDDLSSHLASRQEVGKLLRECGVPTLEFRASIILGSGSLSFEMIRSLVERLPAMITPTWVRSRSQPIAIDDVIRYLMEGLTVGADGSVIYEIGGPDVVSYGDLMQAYAAERGLRRIIVPVPVLSPGLSSRWLGLVTPLYARIGRKLIDSVKHDTVVHSDRARIDFPDIQPRTVREAIARALGNEDDEFARTRWSDSVSSAGDPPHWGGRRFGKRLVDVRRTWVDAPAPAAFHPIQTIGGTNGWYYGNWLWKIRAYLDLLVGGVGLRRGRAHPTDLQPGQTLDFWRVEAIDPPRLLRLRAEMKVPGRAWLQFEVDYVEGESRSRITQTAEFDPVGLLGIVYWYALWPIHQLVFSGMLSRIGSRAADPR